MTAFHADPQKEIAANIEYGEAILTALRLKARRQLEVIAPDQHKILVALCHLILDMQAVQEKLGRERWRLSTLQL